jgi:tryptophanase
MSNVIDCFIKEFQKLLDFSPELPRYVKPRPYRNAVVRFRKCSMNDFDKRRKVVEEIGLNSFMFPANLIPGCDLLSDSGTTTMTMEQLSQILLGDEAYGSNEGYFELKDQIERTYGPEWKQLDKTQENLFIFHQGRAAEHALFTLLREDLENRGLRPDEVVIPSNSHFDTTEANIEKNRMLPLNLPCQEHLARNENYPFRGNIDLDSLTKLIETKGDKIPVVYLTITNNTGGGQPVSMANIRKVHEITKAAGIPFFIDASRFAENAWFIKQRENGYRDISIEQIIHEMFSYCDGFHTSFKKDGLVNIGGGIVLKQAGIFTKKYPKFAERLYDHQILTEGHPTYGGLAGRDLKGLVQGLKTVVREEYLNYRMQQVEKLGEKLIEYNIPVIRPIGGHAVYIDMDGFFDNQAKDEDFKGVAFTALMLIAGHRLCELGIYAFGKFRNGKEIPPSPRVNYVRAAVPRLAYENQDLLTLAESVKCLHDNQDKIPGVEVLYGRELPLRHFKSRFKFKI